MGNCLRRESSPTVWAGDGWESLAPHDHEGGERERLLAGGGVGGGSGYSLSRSTSPTAGRDQMKIKITKKELEELVRMAYLHGSSVEQVLSDLVNNTTTNDSDSDHDHDRWKILMERQRSWRPALQSIPEVN